MEDYNAYKNVTAELDSVETQQNLAKTAPTSPTKPGKRESRHAKIISVNPISPAMSMSGSASRAKSSSSGPPVISNLPKLLTRFLEVRENRSARNTFSHLGTQNFFASCVTSEIEEFAVKNLFETLTPGDPPVSANVVPTGSISRDPAPGDSAPVVLPLKPEALSQLHYLSIKQEDIVKYLNHASKSKSGNWPVVVSQRGIRRMREYIVDNKDVFLRVEKKMK